jgi:hypothetical protein
LRGAHSEPSGAPNAPWDLFQLEIYRRPIANPSRHSRERRAFAMQRTMEMRRI